MLKEKILMIFILGVLLFGFISAQANYSKCIPEDPYLKKKMARSFIGKILLLFFPVGWVNWITSYAAYEEEINCVVNETENFIKTI